MAWAGDLLNLISFLRNTQIPRSLPHMPPFLYPPQPQRCWLSFIFSHLNHKSNKHEQLSKCEMIILRMLFQTRPCRC